jgi:hypothetical protein
MAVMTVLAMIGLLSALPLAIPLKNIEIPLDTSADL